MTTMDLPARLLSKLDARLVCLLRQQGADAGVRVIARLSRSLTPVLTHPSRLISRRALPTVST